MRHRTKPSIEYNSWCAMIQRCTNPKHENYRHYGGRGITVCERWRSSANFLSDMGLKPDPSYTLERRDNSLGYSPQNCYWASKSQQARNRRKPAPKTHCINGHEYSELTTYRNPRGFRVCTLCRLESMRRFYRRSKALPY